MDLFKDLEEDTRKAIKWIAAEFEYLKKVKARLEEIEQATDTAHEEKAYRKVRHVWRYVSRCERRAERNIEEVVEELKKAVQIYPNLRKLETQIEIPEGKLVKAFSFYTGDFNKKLVFLSLEFRTKEKYFGEKAQQIDEKIKTTAKELEHYVDTLIEWIGGIEASLKQLEHGLREDESQKLRLMGPGQYSQPIVARFQGVFGFEHFLKKGYTHKEGFLRENGSLPYMVETMEDYATRTVEGVIEYFLKLGPVCCCWRIVGLNLLMDHEIDKNVMREISKIFGDIFSKIGEDINHEATEKGIEEGLQHYGIPKTVAEIKKDLSDNPGLVLKLLYSYEEIAPYVKGAALYNILVVLDPKKTTIEKGTTVSGATYFSCNPDALVSVHIIHRNPLLKELVKKILLKMFKEHGVSVPIYDFW
tara:strand:+ start:1524 stop:2774 length:1251 start_codon:yes stop_codon:yes gene_type:complete